MTRFVEKIESFIRSRQLLDKERRYLVALSGGADSVALLLSLRELGYQIEACHCNFQLRGTESDRDEQFCVNLCQDLSIPLHRIHFDTRTYADLHKESIELAARNLRYRYFGQLKTDIEADGICVAHHMDDSVETVLINLIRGTGVQGLTGIAAKNGDILRPLLCIDRKEILEYLQEKNQDFVTDSTNLVDDVVRNKIRLNIIPMLKEINPAVCKNIAATAHYLEEANKILTEYNEENGERFGSEKRIVSKQKQRTNFSEKEGAKEENKFFEEGNCNSEKEEEERKEENNFFKGGSCNFEKEEGNNYSCIAKAKILESASPEYSLFMSLSPFGFTGKAITEILVSINAVGKIWESATHQLLIDRETIIIREKSGKSEPSLRPFKIPETGCYVLHLPQSTTDMEEMKIKLMEIERTPDFVPSKERMSITLDAEKIHFPLTLRLTQSGDIFQPYGMKGKKLVSDYLTDKKKNLFEKQEQLVLTDAEGKIIWLIGERTSDLCKIEESTEKVLRIEFTK